MAAEGGDVQVRVRFVTTYERYRVPEAGFAVPSRLTRLGLSEVINHLLGIAEKVPFDFLIQNEFLRSSLGAFLLRKNISAEAEVKVEYLPILPEPEPTQAHQQPDWISALATVSRAPVFASACYDGTVRLHDSATGEVSSTVHKHRGPAKATALAFYGGRCLCASGAKDNTLLVSAGTEQDIAAGGGGLRVVAQGKAHTDSVEAVVVSALHSMVVSAGWDGRIFATTVPKGGKAAGDSGAQEGTGKGPAQGVEEEEEESDSGANVSVKRRRGAAGKAAPAPVAILEPSVAMAGHSGHVAALAWRVDGEQLFSGGGADGTLRLWDVRTGDCISTAEGGKTIAALDYSRGARLVAAAHPDHCVRLWDDRASRDASVTQVLRSHTSWVADVAWLPGSDTTLASCDYEGSVKVWDVRSKVPLHTIAAHEDKALALAWVDGSVLATGGADAQVRLYQQDGREAGK